MKIYHKKPFFTGLLLLAGAGLFVFLNLRTTGTLNIADWLEIIVLVLFAAGSIYAALNPQRAREAVICENDEREQLLALKHYRTVFWAGVVIMAAIGFSLSLTNSEFLSALGLGFFLSSSLLLLLSRVIALIRS